ncbi:MAG: NAD(P)-dependent alcohol dehydrogenase [Chloroflexi bacterium]|nr:NAD(P)-dependent alcohol dehydrogenase [Chloroflexota bacterium]
MKAIVYRKFGLSDVLHMEDVDKPVPKDNEVLVSVHAASINDWDWGLLRGKPFVNRLPKVLKPKHMILGCDVAGKVEAVGSGVTQFQQGDEVFGDLSGSGFGGFAEYVCAHENALSLKPASMTFEQAASVPQASALAMQGLRNKKQIQPGQKVLINGGGGGAGSFAIQIAKSFGAEVTGVDSARKLDMMRAIGVDHVIDYAEEDFTKNGQRYDLINDNAAHHSVFDYRRALNDGGVYGVLGGATSRIFQVIFLGPIVSLFSSKSLGLVLLKPNKDMDFFIELFEAGKVKPIIDKTYPLSETSEAFRYFGESQQCGKIVINVKDVDG